LAVRGDSEGLFGLSVACSRNDENRGFEKMHATSKVNNVEVSLA